MNTETFNFRISKLGYKIFILQAICGLRHINTCRKVP
jgi:hypothetical protein